MVSCKDDSVRDINHYELYMKIIGKCCEPYFPIHGDDQKHSWPTCKIPFHTTQKECLERKP